MYLEVILAVNGNSWTEYVAHHDEVRVGVTDRDAVHSHVLWQTSVCVSFNDVLNTTQKIPTYCDTFPFQHILNTRAVNGF